MFSRAFALCFVVLITVPCSAPFSVCDIKPFLESAQPRPDLHPLRSQRPAPSVGDRATAHALPVIRVSPRVNGLALLSRNPAVLPGSSGTVINRRIATASLVDVPLDSPLRI